MDCKCLSVSLFLLDLLFFMSEKICSQIYVLPNKVITLIPKLANMNKNLQNEHLEISA